ncbi:unnamed protein product [Prunus armeniaca]|uniref:Uncharacterized protein n=1 Tax=Prunus armeniaca TaxID=36596 RepID=A0A6J5TVW3_PRUAR|nr:unnamed protein product [Prunus armeniaca]
MTSGSQMLNTKPTVSLKEANHKTVCFVYKCTGTETSQTSSSLPGTQCLLCNSENLIKGGSTTLPLPSSGAFGLCFVEQSHHRLRDKLGLSSSTWCAHKGSLRSCPRGRLWSPQPNFRHSKGSLDPSCPNVRPPLHRHASSLENDDSGEHSEWQ